MKVKYNDQREQITNPTQVKNLAFQIVFMFKEKEYKKKKNPKTPVLLNKVKPTSWQRNECHNNEWL